MCRFISTVLRLSPIDFSTGNVLKAVTTLRLKNKHSKSKPHLPQNNVFNHWSYWLHAPSNTRGVSVSLTKNYWEVISNRTALEGWCQHQNRSYKKLYVPFTLPPRQWIIRAMKIVFPLWKNAIISKFHWNSFLEVQLTIDYLCLFGSGNGLASNSLKAIIWANDGLFYIDAYVLLGFHELI